jgi:hypothetical protein
MNTLSWMIYLADVFGSLKIFTGFIAGGLGIAGAVWLVCSLDCDDKEGVKVGGKLLSGMVAMAFLSCIIPGEKTMMRITASEMAERVITNPQVQNVIDPSITYLRLWLGKQIKELEGSNK